MLKDLWVWIRVVGRPKETRLTLVSMGRCDVQDRMTIHVHQAIPPDESDNPNQLGIEFFKKWNRGTGNLLKTLDEPLDIVSIIDESGLQDITIIEDTDYLATPGSFRRAIEAFLQTPSTYQWFIWVENDVLFNPDWFDGAMAIYEDAIIDGFSPGIIFPWRTTHPKKNLYGDRDLGEGRSFLLRRCGPSACWVIPRHVIHECFQDLSYYLDHGWQHWDHDTTSRIMQAGYQNLVARKSIVQHIGQRGACVLLNGWKFTGYGGLGFVPHDAILDLYNEIPHQPRQITYVYN